MGFLEADNNGGMIRLVEGLSNVVDKLREDHELVRRDLKELSNVRSDFESKPLEFLGRLEEVLTSAGSFFNDKHVKREERLFMALERRGLPIKGSIVGGLILEHKGIRKLYRIIIGSLKEYRLTGDEELKDKIASRVRSYVKVVESHIEREENELFPLARRLLTKEDADSLLRYFKEC